MAQMLSYVATVRKESANLIDLYEKALTEGEQAMTAFAQSLEIDEMLDFVSTPAARPIMKAWSREALWEHCVRILELETRVRRAEARVAQQVTASDATIIRRAESPTGTKFLAISEFWL
jgi:hypothetical protein